MWPNNRPNVIYRHLNFDSLFELVLARTTSPSSPAAVAMAFRFPCVKSVRACVGSATDRSEFTRWYPRRIWATLRLGARPVSFEPFRREMGEVYNLARTFADSEVSDARVFRRVEPPALLRLCTVNGWHEPSRPVNPRHFRC